MFFAIIVYKSYFGTLPSYYDLSQLGQVGSVKESIGLLIKPSYFIFFIDFILLFLIPLRKKLPKLQLKIRWIATLLIFAIIISYVHFNTNKTDTILDPMGLANEKGIFNYQLLQYYADKTVEIDIDNLVTNEEIYQLKGIEYLPVDERKYFGLAEKRNLIIIQIESLQNFVVNLTIDGQEITPNLNNLAKESFYFNNVYQQIGAGNTSDAEFLVNTSLYPIGNKPTSKVYSNKAYPSLPRLLSDNGYFTTTFHADDITYWNRNALYPALGFDKYYDIEFYGDEDIIGFGPSDEVFFNKTSPELSKLSAEYDNFYAHVLTLTSHTPFELPESKRMITLPRKYEDTLVGNYLLSAYYTDYALGEFINQLKESNIWDNSMIVLYGDHSGLHGELLKDVDVQLMNELLGHGYSLLDRFNIPLTITVPGETTEGLTFENIGGQIDIMPTVTNLLGVPIDEQIHFGQDLLNHTTNLLGMRYYLPAGSFLNNEVMLIPETSNYPKRVYDIETKQKFETNEYNKYYNQILQLLEWSDTYIRSLPRR